MDMNEFLLLHAQERGRTMWKYSFIAFAGVLAYVVGSGLSPVALTVLAGVGVGLLASIPVVIVVAAMATPHERSLPAPIYQYPPVIVVGNPERYGQQEMQNPLLLPAPELTETITPLFSDNRT